MIGPFIEFVLGELVTFPFVFFSKEKKRNRKINRLEVAKTNDFYDNQVYKVVGKVKMKSKLIYSPIQGKECVAYETLVNRVNQDWLDKVINEKKGNDFYVESNGFKCLVCISKSDLSVKLNHVKDTGLINKLNDNLKSYLNKYRVSVTSFGFNKSFQFYEGLINERDEVLVCGEGKWIEVGKGEKCFQFSTSKENRLVISTNYNRNRKI